MDLVPVRTRLRRAEPRVGSLVSHPSSFLGPGPHAAEGPFASGRTRRARRRADVVTFCLSEPSGRRHPQLGRGVRNRGRTTLTVRGPSHRPHLAQVSRRHDGPGDTPTEVPSTGQDLSSHRRRPCGHTRLERKGPRVVSPLPTKTLTKTTRPSASVGVVYRRDGAVGLWLSYTKDYPFRSSEDSGTRSGWRTAGRGRRTGSPLRSLRPTPCLGSRADNENSDHRGPRTSDHDSLITDGTPEVWGVGRSTGVLVSMGVLVSLVFGGGRAHKVRTGAVPLRREFSPRL